jgi:hypothetical protein
MASASTSTDWISYYRSNRGDGGTIEALFNLDDDELAVISKGHYNNVGAFRSTIANSGGGNFLLIPGPKGTVQLLHQGFVSTTTLGGATILGFIQGKFSSSPFKTIVRPADAVKPIDLGRAMTRGQAAPAACPTAKSIFSVSNAEEFAALPGEVDTLDGMPNHIFVHPRIFTRTDGVRATRSKDLAWDIIKQLTEELNNATTDSERADVVEEQDNVEVLLAFLWASERGLLSPVTLGDMEESPHLNHQCELILNKIRTPVNSQAGTSLNSASGLAVATHSLMISMQNTENNRIQERAEDKSAKSLIRNLSPRQQALFTKLCTTDMRTVAKMPPFIVSCLAEKTPIRATNLIQQASRKWKGGFSEAGLSRFLAGGYVSQEGHLAEPGGFTGFMFYPKSPLSKGTSTESAIKGRGRIREFLEMDADEETLKFYQKKEFFVPTTEHELKIVLQTWHDLLELLTVKDTIATEGLALILENYDDHYQVIQEMFTSIKDYGLTVMVILDHHLQKFFDMVSEMDDVTKASPKERHYLLDQARDFLDGLENRRPPAVVIPQCLRRTPTPTGPKATAEVGGDEGPAAKKKKRAAKKATDDKSVVTNTEPQQAWSIPQGKSFLDFFNGTKGNDVGWPRLTDSRFESTRNMCVRFQVKGACTQGCTLAHTVKSKMTGAQESEVSTKFRQIYGK